MTASHDGFDDSPSPPKNAARPSIWRVLLLFGSAAALAVVAFMLRPRSPAVDATRAPQPAALAHGAAGGAAKAPPRLVSAGGAAEALPTRAPSKVCAACLDKRCPAAESYENACAQIAGAATAGPATGQPKSDLCSKVRACVRRQGCIKDDVDAQPCFCGRADDVACLEEGKADGPCKDVLEQAAESQDPDLLAQRWTMPTFAIAQGVRQAVCETQFCKQECAADL